MPARKGHKHFTFLPSVLSQEDIFVQELKRQLVFDPNVAQDLVFRGWLVRVDKPQRWRPTEHAPWWMRQCDYIPVRTFSATTFTCLGFDRTTAERLLQSFIEQASPVHNYEEKLQILYNLAVEELWMRAHPHLPPLQRLAYRFCPRRRIARALQEMDSGEGNTAASLAETFIMARLEIFASLDEAMIRQMDQQQQLTNRVTSLASTQVSGVDRHRIPLTTLND